jgi:CRISPR/Cas system-associated exonuclease Cas4 (RecB family)
LLPRNPAALLGTIAHQLLKEAGQSAEGNFDPVRQWDELSEKLERELKQSWLERPLVPLKSSGRMYEVLKLRSCARALEIASSVQRRTTRAFKAIPGIGFEVWVESEDKSVVGLIDAARMTIRGLVLSDVKSGEVLEHPEGFSPKQLKESHRIQLKLYAALYFQTYRRWPDTLQIVPLTGETVEVPFDGEECSQILKEAQSTVHSLNASITSGTTTHATLANPTPQNCAFCPYRPGCRAYRLALARGEQLGQWPPDIFGMVWDINALSDGRVNLRVAGDGGGQHTIRALRSHVGRHPTLQSIQRGDRIGFFNARVSSNRAEFSEGPLATLYKILRSGDAAD